MTTKGKRYGLSVDGHDIECLLLQGQEIWEDDFASPPKSIGEIIVNAANYSPNASEKYFTYMERPLWCEPRNPNPKNNK